MSKTGRITQYKDPLIIAGETRCKEDRFTRQDENGWTYYRYNCPYCDQYSDHYSVLQWPLRRIKHTKGCDWYWAWLHRKTKR